ncbi:MAG TPA: SUMF1/EgtB/PvdO family nonheme iron enzyme, partial [Candidatus Sumerlaeota bacterium]|nr:SUMF1/EgtB/PvdO family nonheme iron enzyme [Candidatus Sumerlaeota bacterium]
EREKTVAYRLPTEAEWEYAARAGTSTAYYWGDTFDGLEGRYAWTGRNFAAYQTQKVGLRAPNPWGLYDMIGNVEEFCGDNLEEYKNPPLEMVDPKGPEKSSFYVLRGGSYQSYPDNCRVASRNPRNTYDKRPYFGFRVVAVPAGSESAATAKPGTPKQP